MTGNHGPAQPQDSPPGNGGLDPGHILAYIPPRTWKHTLTRLFYEGVWGLYTAAEWNGGEFQFLPQVDRLHFAARDASAQLLAEWAGQVLGRLVCLEPDATQSAAGREGTLWRVAPVFLVRPDTTATACPRCGARLAWRAEGAVHACPDQYTVSAWPPDHECREAALWSLLVAYRGSGRWAVEVEFFGEKAVLTRSGTWAADRNGDPGYRFTLAEALDAALTHAPAVTIADRTAAQALAAHQARRCPDQ